MAEICIVASFKLQKIENIKQQFLKRKKVPLDISIPFAILKLWSSFINSVRKKHVYCLFLFI